MKRCGSSEPLVLKLASLWAIVFNLNIWLLYSQGRIIELGYEGGHQTRSRINTAIGLQN
jgi:hypothetical protein